MKLKIAILHNILAPYRFSLFNAISKKSDIDLEVLFMSDKANNRRWDTKRYIKLIKFKFTILPYWKIVFPTKERLEYIINPTIFKKIFSSKYKVIITAGWLDFSCQVIYFLSRVTGLKYIIWSESTVHENSIQRRLTLPFVKWLIKGASSYIAIGTRSKEYLISLGAEAKKIVIAYSTVDIDYFRHVSNLTLQEKAFLRKETGIPEKNIVFLYVGQFIPRKAIDLLIKAYAKVEKANTSLVLIGYGSEKEYYTKLIEQLKLKSVVILPHVEVDQMPKFYGMSDIFILPSYEETWGLVVNEAMASGLAVIVSDRVGSSVDLVEGGVNGYIFPSGDIDCLAECMINSIRNDKVLQGMKYSSSKKIAKFSPENAASQFIKAANMAVNTNS